MSSIAARLDLAFRAWNATKQTRCSMATQYQYERAIEKLLGEACAEFPALSLLERAALAHVLAKVTKAMVPRKVVEQEVVP